MNRLAVAVALIAGIAVGGSSIGRLPVTAFAAAFLGITGFGGLIWCLSKRRRKQHLAFFSLTIIAATGLLLGIQSRHLMPRDDIRSKLDRSEAKLFPVEGTVWSHDVRPGGNERLLVNISHADAAESSGWVQLHFDRDDFNDSFGNEFLTGSRVIVMAALRPLPATSREHDMQRYRGLSATGAVTQVFSVKPSGSPVLAVVRSTGWLRWKGLQFIAECTRLDSLDPWDPRPPTNHQRAGALLQALTFGDREALKADEDFEDLLSEAGLYHIIAISGLHVGIIAFLIFGTFRLGFGSTVRAAWPTIGVLFVFWMMSGYRASVTRAVVIAALYLLGRWLGRPVRFRDTLLTAAISMLLVKPEWLFDIGFQLSFAAVGCIAVLTPSINTALPGTSRVARWTKGLVGGTFAAQVGTLPFTMGYFGHLPLLPVVQYAAALPILWLIYVVVIPALLVAPVWRAGAEALLEIAIWLAQILAEVIVWGADFPLSTMPLPHPPVIVVVGLAVSIALLVATIERARSGSSIRMLRNATAACVGLSLAGWLTLAGFPALRDSYKRMPLAVFFDVGQGNATLLTDGNDDAMLIDFGVKQGTWDVGERILSPWLGRRGLAELTAGFVTHDDSDHGGGFASVAARFDGLDQPTAAPKRFEFLEDNDRSHVYMADVHGVRILITGDLSAAGEAQLVRRYGEHLRADILLAGHHGDHKATTAMLLDTVQPQVVIGSAGRFNRYGHPGPRLLARLRERNITFLRTDLHGNVSLHTGPNGPYLHVEHAAPQAVALRLTQDR